MCIRDRDPFSLVFSIQLEKIIPTKELQTTVPFSIIQTILKILQAQSLGICLKAGIWCLCDTQRYKFLPVDWSGWCTLGYLCSSGTRPKAPHTIYYSTWSSYHKTRDFSTVAKIQKCQFYLIYTERNSKRSANSELSQLMILKYEALFPNESNDQTSK